MATEEVKLDIEIGASGAAKTLGELEENAEGLLEALKKTEIGSVEFKKLNQELIATNRQVKNLELGFESLDKEQVASELGSVAGAIGDVTAAFILLGGQDEEIEKIAKNIEKALGVSIAFKGAIEGASSARKLWNDVLARSNKLTKIAAVVQKVFNAVLKANPIGLIITAITILIGVFVLLSLKVKEVKDFFISLGSKVHDLLEFFGAWKFLILALLGPIGLLIAAWDFFFGEQAKAMDEQSKREKELAKERAEQAKQVEAEHQRRLKQIREDRDARIAAADQNIKGLELQISTREAEGKSVDALTIKVLEAEKEKLQAVLDANRLQVESARQKFEDLAALRGQSNEEFKKSLRAQGIDLDDLQERANAVLEENERNVQLSQNKITKFKREAGERNAAVADKIRQEELVAEQKLIDEKLNADELLEAQRLELLNRRIAAQKEIDKIEIQNIKDQDEKKKAELVFSFEESILLLDERIEEENQLIIAKRLQLEEQLIEIDEAKAERLKEVNDKRLEELDAAREEEIEKTIDNADKLLNIAESFASIAGSKNLKRIKDKEARGEALTKSEIKRLQREEKVQRAFAIGQVAIDTARGISAAVAAGAGLLFPANIPAILSGVAAVLGGVAQANSILGQSSSVDVGSLDSDASTGLPDEQTQNVPNINEIQFGSTLLNDQPQIVAIVDDINDGQDRVATIVEQATFS